MSSLPIPRDSVLHDAHPRRHRVAALGLLETGDVTAKDLQLQHGSIERVADGVREPHGQRAHRGHGLGVRRASLERSAVGHVSANAVHELDSPGHLPHSEEVPCDPDDRSRPIDRPRLQLDGVIDTTRLSNRLLERLALSRHDEAVHEACSDDGPGLDPHEPGGARIGEAQGAVGRHGDDEHVRAFDQCPVAVLEDGALALERYLSECLVDRGMQLLGAKRFQQEGERPCPQGGDGDVHACVPGHHDDFAEGRAGEQRFDEIDASRVGELDIDERHVEAMGPGSLESRGAICDQHDLDTKCVPEDLGNVCREFDMVVDHQDARSHLG